METRFTILLWEVGIAVLIQSAVLIGILLTVRKSSAKMEALADDLNKRVTPAIESVNAFVQTARPQMENMVANLNETTTLLKDQVQRIDGTISDIMDRTRLQVVRADELVSRTMDKVETTTEFVQHTVISPVRQVAAVIQALTAGLGVFAGRRQSNGNGARVQQNDEMFI